MLKAKIYKEDRISMNIYAPNNTESKTTTKQNKTICYTLNSYLDFLYLKIPSGTWGKCTWFQFHFTRFSSEQNENKRVDSFGQNIEHY